MKNFKRELQSLADRLDLDDLSQALYFPKYFEIETVRACNARCKMCTVDEWSNLGNRMNDYLFDKISEEISHYSDWVNRVCVSRNGEPLLDKKLSNRIKKLKEYGVKEVSFSTNASLLNEKKSIELIESGLDDIRFSIDGITKKTFESIRIGLNYERIRDNCLRFIQLRNKYGDIPKIHLRMTLQNENIHEEEEWEEYWLSQVSENDVVSSKPMHSWGNQLDVYEKTEEDIYEPIPCISPWSTMVIHFDGKIPLCGCDFNNIITLGDLKENSIKEIWQSENFEKIRNLHASGKKNEIPLCFGCNVWDIDRKKIYDSKGK